MATPCSDPLSNKRGSLTSDPPPRAYRFLRAPARTKQPSPHTSSPAPIPRVFTRVPPSGPRRRSLPAAACATAVAHAYESACAHLPDPTAVALSPDVPSPKPAAATETPVRTEHAKLSNYLRVVSDEAYAIWAAPATVDGLATGPAFIHRWPSHNCTGVSNEDLSCAAESRAPSGSNQVPSAVSR